MNLTIDEMFLESSGPNCTFDWVMVYDGHPAKITDDIAMPGVKTYGKYCGRMDRIVVYGSGTQMMVVAHTDSEIGKRGFRAVYQVCSLLTPPYTIFILCIPI